MNNKTTVFLAIILASASLCTAETIILDAVDTGSYDERGYCLLNDDSSTGITHLGARYRSNNSFFVFSIPEFDTDIQDVTLSLELTMYASNDAFEDICISAVSTPIDQLIISHSYSVEVGMAPEIYSDLMDGPELGVMQVNVGTLFPFVFLPSFWEHGPVFSCILNQTAVQMIQDVEGGTFAVGMSLVNTRGDEDEWVDFNSSFIHPDFQIQQLQITLIPEPATLLLVSIGAFLLRSGKRK